MNDISLLEQDVENLKLKVSELEKLKIFLTKLNQTMNKCLEGRGKKL